MTFSVSKNVQSVPIPTSAHEGEKLQPVWTYIDYMYQTAKGMQDSS